MRNACSDVEARGKGDQTAAVDARRDIARAAQASRHDVGHAAYRGIAGSTAKGRVVKVQGVDVDRKYRNAALFALRHRPIALQQFFEIGQGEKPGEAIVTDRHGGGLVRPAQRIPRKLGVDVQPFARVSMMADIVGDAALVVEQRQNRHLVPKYPAVFAVVSQQHPAGLAQLERLAQAVPAVLFAIIRLQET